MQPGGRVAVELELPSGEPRERLLDALARLIRLRGFETFVGAPLLLPEPRFFPERWERSLRGAGRLLTRLLRYANLDAFAVRLRGFRRPASEVGERVWIRQYGDTAAAWYAGTHAGVCHFGLELRGLDNEELLVAALAHEVAHAFREKHDLCARDRDAEEKLTDLTAVYLGFGVFLANASLLVESGGYSESGQRLLYARHSLGYLSPAEFALLLSAQVVARGRSEERRALRAALRPNHAQLFERGCEEFSLDPTALRARLGVPEPEAWPSPPPIDDLLTKPVTDDDIECIEADDVAAPSDTRGELRSSEQVAFRVRQRASAPFAMGGFVVAFLLGAVLEPPGAFWLVLLTAGTVAGYYWGARRHADECSGCRARLAPEAERCDGCHASIVRQLRFSEDEAFRRVAAARLVRRFPALLDALASGELHLTGLLMLGPHLSEGNLVEVLARAKHRTKRELARLVRRLDPLPAVPARIEPLGSAPARLVPPEPTWQEFIASTCPVRELAPCERPREWMEGANDSRRGLPDEGRETMGDRETMGAGAPDHLQEELTRLITVRSGRRSPRRSG